MANPTVTSLKLTAVAGSDTDVLADWVWPKDHTDYYQLQLYWYNGKTTKWVGEATQTVRPSPVKEGGKKHYKVQLRPPTNVNITKVYVKVHPVSTKYTNSKKKQVSYWTAGWAASSAITAPAASALAKEKAAKPIAPTNLRAALNTNGTVSLTWTAKAAYATHAEVWRSADGGDWARIAKIAKKESGSYRDDKAGKGHAYRYRVRVVLKDGKTVSDYTAIASTVGVPLKVSDFKAACYTIEPDGLTGAARLTWTNQGKTGDEIEVQHTRSVWAGDDVETATLETTGEKFTVTGLETNVRWAFRMRRISDGGNGPWSDTVYLTLGAEPSAPTVIDTPPAFAVGDQAELRWTHNVADGGDQKAYELQLDVYAPAGTLGNPVKEVADIPIDTSSRSFALPSDFVELADQQRDADTDGLHQAYYINYSCKIDNATESYEVFDRYIGYLFIQYPRRGYRDNDIIFDAESLRATVVGVDNIGNLKSSEEILGDTYRYSNYKVTSLRYNADHETIVLEGGSDMHRAVDLSDYPDGTEIRWKVRTLSQADRWSPWSAVQSFRVFSAPVAGISLTGYDGGAVDAANPLTGFPLDVSCTATADGGDDLNILNLPIEWTISIRAAEGYEDTAPDGTARWVGDGEVLYSRTVQVGDDGFDGAEASASVGWAEASLANGMDYIASAWCATSQGFRSEAAEQQFTAQWDGEVPLPEARCEYDDDDMTCTVMPVCYEPRFPQEGTVWMLEGTTLTVYAEGAVSLAYVDAVDSIVEASWEAMEPPQEFELGDLEGYAQLDTLSVGGEDVTGAAHEEYDSRDYAEAGLSVYRLDPDGTPAEIATGLANDGDAACIDPHPGFGGCSYRIIATSVHTGQQAGADMQADTGNPGIVVQWDEEWSAEEDGETIGYTGKRVVIPKNMTITPRREPDRILVGYAGRRERVGYSGTLLNSGIDIEARLNRLRDDDAECMAGIEQLAGHLGESYIRTPDGRGFEAFVDVQGPTTAAGSAAAVYTITAERVEDGVR